MLKQRRKKDFICPKNKRKKWTESDNNFKLKKMPQQKLKLNKKLDKKLKVKLKLKNKKQISKKRKMTAVY